MSRQRLRPIRWKKFEQFLLDNGCTYKRQKGSHRVYSKPELLRPIILPAHTLEVPVGVIINNLRTLGVSIEEYLAYLDKKSKHKNSQKS